MTPEPANDNFKTRFRSVTDKRTGRVLRVLNTPRRDLAHEALIREARSHMKLNEDDKIIAFAMFCLRADLASTSSVWVDEDNAISPGVVAAAAQSTFTYKLHTSQCISSNDEEDPPPCA